VNNRSVLGFCDVEIFSVPYLLIESACLKWFWRFRRVGSSRSQSYKQWKFVTLHAYLHWWDYKIKDLACGFIWTELFIEFELDSLG
jgi:hypothetical protein